MATKGLANDIERDNEGRLVKVRVAGIEFLRVDNIHGSICDVHMASGRPAAWAMCVRDRTADRIWLCNECVQTLHTITTHVALTGGRSSPMADDYILNGELPKAYRAGCPGYLASGGAASACVYCHAPWKDHQKGLPLPDSPPDAPGTLTV